MTDVRRSGGNPMLRRRLTLGILAVCALMGVTVAVLGAFAPFVGVALLLCLFAGLVLQSMVGTAGFLAMAPVLFAFLLMVRFDEALCIPVGTVKMKATYWSTVLCAAALAIYAWRPRTAPARPPTTNAFLARLSRYWALFAAVGIVSITVNHLMDRYVPSRYLPGELLALGVICLPVTFAILIPSSDLSRIRTVLCLRGMVLLGGLAGFIMAMFGLLPERMLGYLGWTSAIGGTLDLVRGRLPLGHPNTVAAVLLMLLPVAIVLSLGGRNRLWRPVYLMTAGLMFCGVLFALSRAALVSMSVLLFATLGWVVFAIERRPAGVLLGLAFGFMLVATTAFLFSRYDFSRFWSRGYFEDASVERRADSISTALAVWRDHVVLGAGPDAVYPRFDLRPGWSPVAEDRISPIVFYRGRVTAANPHNFYLTVLAEFGVLGAGLFFAILFRVAATIWRARRNPAIDVFEKRTLTGLGLGIGGFLMMGMFESVLMTGLRSSVIFWVFVGLTLRYAALVLVGASGRGNPGVQTAAINPARTA